MSQLTVEQPAETAEEPIKTTPNKASGDKNVIYLDTYHLGINVSHKPILPVIEAKPDQYIPMPYVFRFPFLETSANFINQTTRAPPVEISLDHAIAVVWSIFSKNEYKKRIGINQLHWAWKFLANLRNDRGRLSQDVQFAMDHIFNELIELYSQMVDEINTEDDEVPPPAATASQAAADDDNAGAADGGDAEGAVGGEEGCGDEAAANAQSAPDNGVAGQKNAPFSYNYADMLRRSPPKPVVINKDIPDCPEGEFKNMGPFLKQWRKDQMRKILIELDRLNTIETYLDSNGENFQPYLDERDKEISILLAEKMKNYKT